MLGKRILAVFFALILFFTIEMQVSAKEVQTGTYSIDYTVLKEGESSTSIANDYFKKPAKLYVKDGKEYVEIVIGKSNWTKKVTLNEKKETLVKKEPKKDERTVQFAVNNLAENQQGTVSVFIDEEVDGEDFLYDNSYGIQFAFEKDSAKKLSDQTDGLKVIEKTKTKKSTNSNNVLIYSAIVLVLIMLIVLVALKMRGRKK